MASTRPSERLETERLILRTPVAADVPHFAPLIGDWDVARNLSTAPHPYSEKDGYEFVERVAAKRERDEQYPFAVIRRTDDAYIGACGLHPDRDWEFGYWIGKPYWGNGYATEAARRLVAFAFAEFDIEYLTAGWFHDNPASGRVLVKLGCESCGSEQHACLARGEPVPCNKVRLTRARWRAMEGPA